MKIRFNHRLKKNWDQYKRLSQSKPLLDKFHRQWTQIDETSIDIKIGERIWDKIDPSQQIQYARVIHSFYKMIAAAAVIALIAGSWWILNLNSTEKYIEIVATQNEIYQLPDSSKVWLQAGSHIRYSSEFLKKREVWLKGEALFDVTKRTESTFKVFLNKAYIEVKGTSFLVEESTHAKQEITLFKGKIDFNIESTHQSIAMIPKQKIIFDSNTNEVESQTIDNMNWQDGRYVFTDIGLNELIQVINQRYHARIAIGENVNAKDLFSGSIQYDEPLEKILKKICYSMNLIQQKKGGEIILEK